MTMQPAVDGQNGRQLRFDATQISSLQRLIPFLVDSLLTPGSAVEMPQQPDWTSRCSQLADRSSPAAIRRRSKSLTKRANLTALLQMQHHHCKMCRSPLHADDTHTDVCHAWGNATLMLCSAGLTALIASFSLASLHSRIAFFSESDSTPSALPFSSCQGLVRKKQRGRGFERPVISKLTSVQCCVLRNHHRESIRPSSSLNTISLPPRRTAIRGQDTSTCLLWMSPWPHISACPRLSD